MKRPPHHGGDRLSGSSSPGLRQSANLFELGGLDLRLCDRAKGDHFRFRSFESLLEIPYSSLQFSDLLEEHRGTWFAEEPVQRFRHLYVPLEGRRAGHAGSDRLSRI